MVTAKPSRWTVLLTELPALGLFEYAAGGLRGDEIEPGERLLLLGLMGAGLILARWLTSAARTPVAIRSGGRNLLTIGLWLALLRWGFGGLLSQPAGLARAVSLPGAALVFAAALRALSRWLLSPPERVATEQLRLGSLAALTAGIFSPYLTPRLLGGLDARWYGYTMLDVLQQARGGVFPVLVGQGEYIYNGAAHPIRTAPFHHYFGILLDALTGRTFSALAVQHLTVLGAALIGALGCYLALAALTPARRWLAWVLALLYVGSPVVVAYIYAQEMYMTFMACAWLPLVAYGNVRVIRRDDRTGWLCLVAGLALVWHCHAPVGMWTTLATGGLQGLRLLTRDFNPAAWGRVLRGGGLFAGLTAYYFWSIAEITPPAAQGSLLPTVLVGAGAAALIRFMVTARWPWLVAVAGAAGPLWFVQRSGTAWLGCALPGAFCVAWGARHWAAWKGRVLESAVVVLLLGGAVALQCWPQLQGTVALTTTEGLASLRRVFPQNFLPVTPTATAFSDLQLGYALWALLVIGVIAAARKKTWELRLFSLVALVLALLYVPVPFLSPFVFSLVPAPIAVVSGINFWFRFSPVLAVLCLFVGGLALSGLMPVRRPARIVLVVLVGAFLAWDAWQILPFVARGRRSVASLDATAAFQQPENAQVYFYSYNNLPAPGYFTHGVVDPLLESRLLRLEDKVPMPDPWFSRAPDYELTFSTALLENSMSWLRLSPRLMLAPAERVRLAFDFADKSYAGALRFEGPAGFHRDYFLPEAGPYGKGFGVAPGHGKTLSLWNTTAQSAEIELSFILNEALRPGAAFGDFARAKAWRYTAAQTQVRTVRWIPHYEAEVQLDAPAFLETPRVFIPGYQARVNGRAVAVQASPDHLAMIRLEAGRSRVELAYRGTFLLRVAMGVSLLTWTGLLASLAWMIRLRPGDTRASVAMVDGEAGEHAAPAAW